MEKQQKNVSSYTMNLCLMNVMHCGYPSLSANVHWYDRVCSVPVHDNYNLKLHKYVCITTYQPDI